MKVLLDEDLPHALRHHLPGHEVVTVRYAGWHGLRNGKLLTVAENAGFQVLITGDKSLPKQQHLEGRSISVIILSSQDWPIMRDHLENILGALKNSVPGTAQVVECGSFQR